MQKQKLYHLLGLSFVLVLSGCVVRTYPLTKDRIDQDLSMGNRGYIGGEMPTIEEKERKTTRTTRVVEVELSSPFKFERAPKKKPVETMPLEKTTDEKDWGNRGYISQSQIPEVSEPVQQVKTEQYTVQKADTLQKISKRFYGTTKKWQKIYEANQDVLKGPNKIYPGQVIEIPIDSATQMESQGKLK